jgi:hypothetical protein
MVSEPRTATTGHISTALDFYNTGSFLLDAKLILTRLCNSCLNATGAILLYGRLTDNATVQLDHRKQSIWLRGRRWFKLFRNDQSKMLSLHIRNLFIVKKN